MSDLVEDIMTSEVVWVNPNESLYDAYQIMKKFEIRHLPVVGERGRELLGLLSEGDIILHCQRTIFSIEKIGGLI